MNSSRDKNITNVNCPHCKFSSTSSSKLKVHLKSCHTRPGLVSPENRKQIKLNNGALCVKAITPERPKLATSSVLMQEVLDLIQCKFCDFDTADTKELDNHIKVKHAQSGFECTDCDKKFKSESDYSIHNKEAHTFNCDLCSKTFSSEAMVSEHFTTAHYVNSPFLCVKCDHTFTTETDLATHIQTVHNNVEVSIAPEDQRVLQCDFCDYQCRLNIQLKKHVENRHTNYQYNCEECSFGTQFVACLWEHIAKVHPDLMPEVKNIQSDSLVIRMIVELNTNILEEIEKLKKDTKGAFMQLASALDDSPKNVKEDILSNLKTVDSRVNAIQVKVASKKCTKVCKPSDQVDDEGLVEKSAVINSSERKKLKVLYTYDEVGHAANVKELEKLTNCRIDTAAAINSIYDRREKLPHKNFTDVVTKVLEKPVNDKYDVVITSAPTADISKLDTRKVTKNSSRTWFENEAKKSSRNFIKLAENMLKKHGSLKNFVVLEHTERFHTAESDPVSLKKHLCMIANSHLHKLRNQSTLKEKLSLVNIAYIVKELDMIIKRNMCIRSPNSTMG